MKNEVNIFKVRQKKWFFYIPLTFVLLLFIYYDYDKDNQIFEDLSFYYSFLIFAICEFLIFSPFANKIILTKDSLIFDYYPWFIWRKKRFMIEDIKTFYYFEDPKSVQIEINLYSKTKTTRFFLIGISSKSISELHHELYNHPLNKLESGLE